MSQITLHEIEEQHAKVAEMIATFKAQAARQVTIPEASIALRDGERYAGIVIEGGVPKHHLILLPHKPDTALTWQDAKDWAAEVGGELPTRFESALLYANLRDEFDTSRWHWTATQYSDACAWYQDFTTGTQHYYDGKTNEFLARAVRRLPL
jgi:hypothetical protein